MQKIYDVKPPQKQKEEKDLKGGEKKKRSYTFWAGIGLFLLAFLGGVYFFIFHVEVEIWPETIGVQLEKTFSPRCRA